MLSEITFTQVLESDGGSFQMQVCMTQICAMNYVQLCHCEPAGHIGWASTVFPAFPFVYITLIFPLEAAPPLFCVQTIQVKLTHIPKVQGWARDQGLTDLNILTPGQSDWLMADHVTDLNQEGQWDSFLGLLIGWGRNWNTFLAGVATLVGC